MRELSIDMAERQSLVEERRADLSARAVTLKRQGLGASIIARRLGIGRATVYRLLGEAGALPCRTPPAEGGQP